MKRGLTLIGTTIGCLHNLSRLPVVHAIPANPLPFHDIQPDGSTTPPLFLRGDDRYNYFSDSAGYKVVKNETGWFVYAEEEKPEEFKNNSRSRRRLSKPGKYRVGEIDPSTRGFPLGYVDAPPPERPIETSPLDGAINGVEDPHNKGGRELLVTKGEFHNLVVLIRFSDHDKRQLPRQKDFDKLYNLDGTHPKIAPTGSVRQVFLDNSYGQFKIVTTVYDWVTVRQPEAYYGNGNNGFTLLKEAITEALDVLEADPLVSFSDFDLDGDKMIDGFGILHSGYGAEFGGGDCYGQINENRIWSHKGGMDWTSESEEIKFTRYYASSALRGKCGHDIVRMGVICHEMGHYLGLPDLYDVSFKGMGIGAYDMMSQSWGFDGSGMFPPLFSAWSKYKVGWVAPEVIEEDGTYHLEASSKGSKVYTVHQGFPLGEYLLIENRQPNGFDSQLPHGGIAIWHVDGRQDGQQDRGYPTQEGWPENGNHYEVALLGADGNYDLEMGSNHGDSTDLWHSGSPRKELIAGPGRYPNTDSYQNGQINRTGIRIYGFSTSQETMTFSIEGISQPVNPPTEHPTFNPSFSPSGIPSTEPSAAPLIKPTNVTLAPVETIDKLTLEPTGLHAKQQPQTSIPTLSSTSNPSSEPSSSMSKPPTTAPLAIRPTLLPSKNPSMAPVSNHPTFSPTQNPTPSPVVMPTASPIEPTSSPITEQESCADLCLEPIDSIHCPSNPLLPNCLSVNIGELCDADGECGTNQFLNNCRGFDIYRKIKCGLQLSINEEDINEPIGTYENTPTMGPTKIDPGLMFNPPKAAITDSSTSEPAADLTLSPVTTPTIVPVKSPTNKPTILIITGAGSSKSFGPGHHAENAYYPGWTLGLNYCLNDGKQPTYMINNPIFEFDSYDTCCKFHYLHKVTCMNQSESFAAALSYSVKNSSSVSGSVVDSTDRNIQQDFGGTGVGGVIVDVFQCDSNEWTRGTRTSGDGSYSFNNLATGRYYLKVTPPEGYRLMEDYWPDGTGENYLIPETGVTVCFELLSEESVKWDASIVFEDEQTETKLSSTTVNGLEEKANNKAESYAKIHSKSPDPKAIQLTRPEKKQHEDASSPSTEFVFIHSKSHLRGSDMTKSDSPVIVFKPVEDTTIKSTEDIIYGGQKELKVGRESDWDDNILMKFNLTRIEDYDCKSAKTAILRLYALSSSPVGGRVHIISDNWDEAHVTWANAPPAIYTLGSIGPTRPNNWVEIDVTGGLPNCIHGILSLRISSGSSNHSWHVKYNSKEGVFSLSPEIRVSF